ncbi:hypothetical protein JL100_030250 (plasmid) [Skermanella mucosa]|uniref:hypothetical protein n=1 Tax=Skermanella mucosa TaxID=1789672 RepID=UPI00192BFA64|nr:hypothetical protein [Skermanella mucosa]UEM24514.1 hypothetical protein JL100_030250 [Skermanella mucosa]
MNSQAKAFDATWGPGAWGRCRDAEMALIKLGITADRLGISHLSGMGIKKMQADDYLRATGRTPKGINMVTQASASGGIETPARRQPRWSHAKRRATG